MECSIIVPLYNKGPYIDETIKSVVAQEFQDWQLIIVDNGSKDDGSEIASRWVELDERIEFASCEIQGPAAARNRGLGLAKGRWILFLDADDLLEPAYLYKMLKRAAEEPQVNIVASSWKEFDANSSEREFVEKLPVGIDGAVDVEDSAIAFTCWAIHAAIIQKSWLDGREWPEELDGLLAEDTAFWFQVVSGAEIDYVDFSGALYRTQTENCRSDYSCEAWFAGTHSAVLANLEYLKQQDKQVSRGQCESLLRFYSGLYTKAKKEKNTKVIKESLLHAENWMAELKRASSKMSLSMRLRGLLGIANFELLKTMASFRCC